METPKLLESLNLALYKPLVLETTVDSDAKNPLALCIVKF
jgi:hypothetical protein